MDIKIRMWTQKILSGHKNFYTDTKKAIRTQIPLYGHKPQKTGYPQLKG